MNRSGITFALSLFLGRLVYYLVIYNEPHSPTSNTDSSELWTVVVICALVPIAAILLIIATAPRPKTVRRHQSQPQPTAKRSNLTRKEQELVRQLVNLLHGDAGAAKRLVHGSLQNNPGRDTVWNLEKVIHDLIRDRSR